MASPEERPRVVLVNRSFVIDNEGKILLIHRATNDRVDPNKWEIPGGKLDEGQDISHALEREVLEETGLLVTPVTRLAYCESSILSSGPYQGFPYVVLVGISTIEAGTIKLSSEHQAYDRVNLQDFENTKYDLTSVTQKSFLVLKDQIKRVVDKNSE